MRKQSDSAVVRLVCAHTPGFLLSSDNCCFLVPKGQSTVGICPARIHSRGHGHILKPFRNSGKILPSLGVMQGLTAYHSSCSGSRLCASVSPSWIVSVFWYLQGCLALGSAFPLIQLTRCELFPFLVYICVYGY